MLKMLKRFSDDKNCTSNSVAKTAVSAKLVLNIIIMGHPGHKLHLLGPNDVFRRLLRNPRYMGYNESQT